MISQPSLRNSTVAMLGLTLIVMACSGDDTAAPSSTTTASEPATTTSTVEIASTTTTTVPEDLEPITGYGDFSGQEYFYVDWFLVTRLTVQCLQDHGFPVTLIPPGDGISFLSVPHSQNQLAQQYLEACREGLDLPDFEFPSPEQIEVMYRYYVALRDCLIAEGYTVSEPPSLDSYIESYSSTSTGPWTPYESVPGDSRWDAIQMKCPQGPPGGWASWEPGDPIIPIEPSG